MEADIDQEICELDKRLERMREESFRIRQQLAQSTPLTSGPEGRMSTRDSGIGSRPFSSVNDTTTRDTSTGTKPKVRLDLGSDLDHEYQVDTPDIDRDYRGTHAADVSYAADTHAASPNVPDTHAADLSYTPNAHAADTHEDDLARSANTHVGNSFLRGQSASRITTRRRQLPSLAVAREQYTGQDSPVTRRQLPRNIKPVTYDGTGSWIDYRTYFDACAKLNRWSQEEKGLYLAVSLRGQAQGVLGNLPTDSRDHYGELVRSLEQRFAPPNQTDLYRAQLKEKRQKASESLPELGQAIRRLTYLAYPTAPNDLQETLAKEHFIDALHDSEMRVRIKQSRPRTFNETVQLAVELEAYNKSEKKHHTRAAVVEDENKQDQTDNITALSKSLKKLQEDMETLMATMKTKPQSQKQRARDAPNKAGPNRNTDIQCFFCKKNGHIARNCPKKKQNKEQKKADGKTNALHGKPTHKTDAVSHSAGVSAACDAGIYIQTTIKGIEVKLLVDTGSTVTIVSRDVFDRIREDDRPSMENMDKLIKTANGSRLEVVGAGVLSFSLGARTVEMTTVIADLTIDGLLGMDFMIEQGCMVDIAQGLLRMCDINIPLLFEGSYGCYRVAVSENICLPPASEMIVVGNVIAEKRSRIPGTCVLEPTDRFISADRALVARAAVSPAANCVPVRLMNITEEPQMIYGGTIVGQLSPMERITHKTNDRTAMADTAYLDKQLHQLLERSREHLTGDQIQKAKAFLAKRRNLFASSDLDLGRTQLVKHQIKTGDAQPIKQPWRKVPAHMTGEVDKHVEDMLQKKVIEPSTGPWSSGIVLIQKKDQTTRFCVDYRKLNAVTSKDAYPLPRIQESLDHLSGNAWFSTLDLFSGYWQVELDKQDRPKTAFSTLIYLDDIIVVGSTFEDMIENLEKVFDRLEAAGLKFKAKKCTLFSKRVAYLGHIISGEGVSTDPEKIAKVKDWPRPTNLTEVQSFLGLCSYYRRFIQGFAAIAKPLHRLSEKGTKFNWTTECSDAFSTLKNALIKAPILALPDFEKMFILDTDASGSAHKFFVKCLWSQWELTFYTPRLAM
ncbi:uncharacterized protein LOC117343329 [Pecten maximus]|uniref:uncharacterized protein LOC117343329 n=1 Tax=Pecten maximus TaxID=6579 RepID=UPI0014590A26|nr:uncharacterized protein LOC117343329 [Pecten maximus]